VSDVSLEYRLEAGHFTPPHRAQPVDSAGRENLGGRDDFEVRGGWQVRELPKDDALSRDAREKAALFKTAESSLTLLELPPFEFSKPPAYSSGQMLEIRSKSRHSTPLFGSQGAAVMRQGSLSKSSEEQ